MAVRSIIDIDVNSEAFKDFAALFDKYKDALAKTPAAWDKVAKSQSSAASAIERVGAAVEGQRTAVQSMNGSGVGSLANAEKSWLNIGNASTTVLRNIVGIGGTIAKWGLGLAAGAIGGGLYGIDKMAEGISDTRQQAMGLGMSIGALQAWQVNLPRLTDPGSFLAMINSMELDVTKQAPWYSLGMGRRMNGNDTAGDATAFLLHLRSMAQSLPLDQVQTMLKARGINLDDETARKLHSMKNPEFAQILAGIQKDTKTMSVQDKTAKAWQDLVTQLLRAKTTIEDVFVRKLVPLAPSFEKLSKAVTAEITSLTGSAGFTDAVKAAAGALDAFSDKLNGFSKGGAPGVGSKTLDWLGRVQAQVLSFLHGNLASDVWGEGFARNLPTLPLRKFTDEAMGSGISAATLRDPNMDLLRQISPLSPISAAAPTIRSTLATPMHFQRPLGVPHIRITPIPGGDVNVTMNGLAAGQ